METFVLDASVAAKWYLEEPLKEKALFLREGFREGKVGLVVPDVFYIEVGNIFRKRVRERQLEAREALDIFDDLLGVPLTRCSDYELSDVALENALRLAIPVYDALYLAVAEVYVAPFVTADEELCKRCHKRFEFIEYLGDWEL